LKGVVHGIDFLREVNLNDREVWVGRKVAVVGGGNAAIDAARSAFRLGAEHVTILYRRTRSEMPAQVDEIEAAEQEGIDLRFLVTPDRIKGDEDGLRCIECQRMRLGEFDRSGRRRPVPIEDSRFELEVDMVISAIGQVCDTDDVLDGLEVKAGRGGVLAADEDGRTEVPYVFAGGDVTSGPATVIEAIAAGERGAVAIDQYLRPDQNRDYPWRRRKPSDVPFDPEDEPVQYGRCEAPKLPAASRSNDFAEVEGALDRQAATREALRCLRCDYRGTEE
jgi:NADH-quinone oxidoreductase subunit F